MSAASQAQAANVAPSWTWGSSARIDFDLSNPGTTVVGSTQLAQVQLPEPAVCSIYFQASFSAVAQFPSVMRTFTLNLLEGVGRVTVPRQISFQFQPSTLSPLEFTLPWVPLHALQVDVEATLDVLSEDPGDTAALQIYLVLSPLTRMQNAPQKLDFGMAEPGEADEMDEELRGNLEDESPSVQAIMEQERLDGMGETAPPIDVEGEEVEAAPAWLLDLVDVMTQRLGRPPKRRELAAVVQRMRQRQARRARRG